MENKNEKVADIVLEMRVYAKKSKVGGGEIDVWNWLADFADRIEAAHNEQVTLLETALKKSFAECSQLRKRLKVAEDALAGAMSAIDEYMTRTIYRTHGAAIHEWKNALAAIREKRVDNEFTCPSRGVASEPKTEAREGRKRCAPLTGSPERESGSKPTSGAASGLAAKTDEAENERTAEAALVNTANGQASRPPRNEGSADGRKLVRAAGLGSRVGRAARASASIFDK